MTKRREMVRSASGKFAGASALTGKQSDFVLHLVGDGETQTRSAELAKYADPGSAAYHLMRNPRVLAAIRAETTRQLGGELASSAVEYLRQVLAFDHTTADGELDAKVGKLKLDAAKTILDRAGYVTPKAPDAASDGPKDLEDYTLEELGQLVRQGRETLDALIDITPSATVDGASSPPGEPVQAQGQGDGGVDTV